MITDIASIFILFSLLLIFAVDILDYTKVMLSSKPLGIGGYLKHLRVFLWDLAALVCLSRFIISFYL